MTTSTKHWVLPFLTLLTSSMMVIAHQGDHRSIEELNALIKENPGEQSLYIARGSFHTRLGQWRKAEHDLRRAQDLGRAENVAFELGRLYYRRGDYLRALDYLYDYLDHNPNYPDALLLIARAATEMNQFEVAAVNYSAYLDMSPQPHPGDYLAAAQLLARDHPANALQILDKGMARLGLIAQLQRYAMTLELDRGDPQSALARWRSLKPQLGNTPEWAITLGQLLITANKRDEAKVALINAKAQLSSIKPIPAREHLHKELSRLEVLIDPNAFCDAHAACPDRQIPGH